MKRALSLALGMACLAGALHAKFTLPLVDFATPSTGTASTIAIWSNTDLTVSAGSSIKVFFPQGFSGTLPNPATCVCVFFKMTYTGSGFSGNNAFSPHEVTVTGGTSSGLTLTVTVPRDMAPGLFYLRLDKSAGWLTPLKPGFASLTLVDAAGTTAESSAVSKGFWIHDPAVADASSSTLNGSVLNLAGEMVPGARVYASTTNTAFPASTSIMDAESGPRANTPSASALETTNEVIQGNSNADGTFSLLVPSGVQYNVYAVYSEWDLASRSLKTYKVSATAAVAATLPNNGYPVALVTYKLICNSAPPVTSSTCPGY